MSFLYPLFSWIVLEHHIHHFDILNAGMTRIERRSKLEERLQRTTSLKPQMIDIIMSRENGVWEAILCMNQGNCVEKKNKFISSLSRFNSGKKHLYTKHIWFVGCFEKDAFSVSGVI